MRGIEITTGQDINYAQPDDFVIDTRQRGGAKRYTIKTINPASDLIFDSVNGYWYGSFSHGLPFIPPVTSFQDGFQGVSFQNNASIDTSSANSDAINVYVQTGSPSLLSVVVFAEAIITG